MKGRPMGGQMENRLVNVGEGKYRQRYGDWKGEVPLTHYREPHVLYRVGFSRRLLEKSQ